MKVDNLLKRFATLSSLWRHRWTSVYRQRFFRDSLCSPNLHEAAPDQVSWTPWQNDCDPAFRRGIIRTKYKINTLKREVKIKEEWDQEFFPEACQGCPGNWSLQSSICIVFCSYIGCRTPTRSVFRKVIKSFVCSDVLALLKQVIRKFLWFFNNDYKFISL